MKNKDLEEYNRMTGQNIKTDTKTRIINKRGYVYVGRANAGQAAEIQIKPKAPTIIIKEVGGK